MSTNCHPCDPCAPACAEPICDERYFSLANGARVKLTGVIPGGKCLTYFTSAKGFLLDDGTGTGQFIAKAPTWLLDFLNPVSGSSWPQPGSGFPVLLALGGDSEGTPWKMIHAPSSGTWFLQANNGLFSFWDAGQIPGVNAIFANASNSTAIEMFGYIQTGTSGGSPVFEARKLTGSGTADQFLVLRYDSGTGRYKITASTPGDVFQRTTIAANQTRGLDVSGNLITGGFSQRDNTVTIGNFSLMAYDSTSYRFYRAPGPTVANNTLSAPVTCTALSTYYTIFDFGTVACNYCAIMVQFVASWYNQVRAKWGLYVDGVLRHEWDYTQTDPASDATVHPEFSAGQYLLQNVAIGNHSIVIKAQTLGGTSGKIVKYGNASLFSIVG